MLTQELLIRIGTDPGRHCAETGWSVSRAMRPGESDGQDYFFVSRQEFHKWLEQGDLLEHAMVYGEYKGIPRSQVEQALERGTDVVLRVDVQGAATIRQILPHSVSIFLVSKSKCCVICDLICGHRLLGAFTLFHSHVSRLQIQRLSWWPGW